MHTHNNLSIFRVSFGGGGGGGGGTTNTLGAGGTNACASCKLILQGLRGALIPHVVHSMEEDVLSVQSGSTKC